MMDVTAAAAHGTQLRLRGGTPTHPRDLLAASGATLHAL